MHQVLLAFHSMHLEPGKRTRNELYRPLHVRLCTRFRSVLQQALWTSCTDHSMWGYAPGPSSLSQCATRSTVNELYRPLHVRLCARS